MGKSFKLQRNLGWVGGPNLTSCSVGNRYKVAGAGYQRLRPESVGKVLEASWLAPHAGWWEKALTRDVTPGFGSVSCPLYSPGKMLYNAWKLPSSPAEGRPQFCCHQPHPPAGCAHDLPPSREQLPCVFFAEASRSSGGKRVITICNSGPGPDGAIHRPHLSTSSYSLSIGHLAF